MLLLAVIFELILLGPNTFAGPQVVYGTYIGGRHKDVTSALAIDSKGNAWVVGSTPSPDFPITPNAFKTRTSVNNDDSVGFVTKVSAAGDRFIYSTFMGGSWRSAANAIAVEESGDALVVGSTCSFDFPVTENALQRKPGGGGHGLESCDGFVVRLDASGPRAVYATYFGGSEADTVNAVAVDGKGGAVVAGWSRSPDLLGARSHGRTDGFIATLNPQGGLKWIKRFGGSGDTLFKSVAISTDGTIWAAGTADSEDLPCSGRVSERPYGIVMALKRGKDPLCLRFAGDPAVLGVDREGHTYVAGTVTLPGHVTGFVLKVNGGRFEWNKRIGGSDETRFSGITAGLAGSLFVCGSSYSRDFPASASAFAHYPGRGSDMVLLRLSAEDGRVLYGTFLGGNAASDIAPMNNTAVAVQADGEGNLWIAGNAIGHPGWITDNAAQSQRNDNTDVFLLKLKMLGLAGN